MSQTSNAVLFQHNVESMIWKRYAEHARTPWHRAYSRSQYERMLRYEAQVCGAAKKIIAVSSVDATPCTHCTGPRACVGSDRRNIEYFAPPSFPSPSRSPAQDLVFLGAMDWRPNIDGVNWFASRCSSAHPPQAAEMLAGDSRPQSTTEVRRLAANDRHIHVTGTVDDVRPYLWNPAVSIVPLRIGGGTRLKIYEAMAARTPVVSTSVGAEGLDVRDGRDNRARRFAAGVCGALRGAARAMPARAAGWQANGLGNGRRMLFLGSSLSQV